MSLKYISLSYSQINLSFFYIALQFKEINN